MTVSDLWNENPGSAKIRVGMIGLGGIGQGVVRNIEQMEDPQLEIVSVLVRDGSRPRKPEHLKIVTTLNELLASNPDVVVEVAGHEAIQEYGPEVLRRGFDMVFISVGALANPGFEQVLRDAAVQGKSVARAVSGGIGGLDALGAAAIGNVESVTHTTRRPAISLVSKAEAAGLTGETEIFRGSAREGALKFPHSVNVAAAVSLASIGLDRTQLQIFADPALDHDVHLVEAVGEFGSLRFEVHNIPSITKPWPKSARLVSMSVIHQVLQMRAHIRLG